MDVYMNGSIFDGRWAVGTGLRVRCTPSGGSFFPPNPTAFELNKVYQLIAEDRSVTIRVTRFVVSSSRPRTEISFITLGPAHHHSSEPTARAPFWAGDTTVLPTVGDPNTDTALTLARPAATAR